MTSHPNRSRAPRPGRTPTPGEIIALRTYHHQTQSEAAQLVYASLRAWQQWEGGDRRMHPAFWELYRTKAIES